MSFPFITNRLVNWYELRSFVVIWGHKSSIEGFRLAKRDKFDILQGAFEPDGEPGKDTFRHQLYGG